MITKKAAMNPLKQDAFIFPLDSPHACLENVGGKGANLARMARAGYPVPQGFLIGVDAYHNYVQFTQIESSIQKVLSEARLDDPAELERAAGQIRGLFRAELLPGWLAESIRAAYQELGAPPVAVRSSATAEDLPEMSFAGQQDTYLNIMGAAALLDAVAACWGSLWTARAIGYRARQGVPQEGLGLAVVVQQMVASAAAGVLFTANPLTGLRSQSVIDAAFGLGEALVSGQVEPDRYIVDTTSGQIVEKKLGAKALAILPKANGGTQTITADASHQQALSDDAILALADLGQRVAAEYGCPQDIEWGWADGRLHLLQTRAITSLFPIPAGLNADDLRVMFSFGAVQGMLDPMTPLGRDMIATFAGGVYKLFGSPRDETTQSVLLTAGERLWGDFTPLVRNPVGRKLARGALRYVEEGSGQNIESIWNDPRLTPADKHLKFSTVRKVVRGMMPIVARAVLTLLRPKQRRQKVVQYTEALLNTYRHDSQQVSGTPAEKLRQRTTLLRFIREFGPNLLVTLLPVLIAGMSQFALLRKQAGAMDAALGAGNKNQLLVLETMRGIPGNVTTEMDLALWDAARAIRADAASQTAFREMRAEAVAKAYQQRQLPPRALEVLDVFLERYGLRGLAEIDTGRARWVEDPLHVIQVLGSYLQIEAAHLAPDVVFARGEQAAQTAVETLAASARKLPLGWLRAAVIRFAAGRMRTLVSIRESPKFLAVRMMGTARMSVLDSGRDYTGLGVIEQPDDLFFLRLHELEALANGKLAHPKALIATRRAAYNREKLRRQIPRLLLSDGRAFYAGVSAPASTGGSHLHGDPVSPGLAEGHVRVVLDPRGVQLAPGEILVCPGTDPSWTPLFLAAGALVMEVGGMMTHGAVVAREYGIPAVVGVHQATLRLKDGQRVRVNGSTGEISLLNEPPG